MKNGKRVVSKKRIRQRWANRYNAKPGVIINERSLQRMLEIPADKRRDWIVAFQNCKGFVPTLGKMIYQDRQHYGYTLAETLAKYYTTKDEHELYMIVSKKYKQYIADAHDAARDWWMAEVGRAAKDGKNNIEMLKLHIINEFGIDLTAMIDDKEKFGFDVIVRPKSGP